MCRKLGWYHEKLNELHFNRRYLAFDKCTPLTYEHSIRVMASRHREEVIQLMNMLAVC